MSTIKLKNISVKKLADKNANPYFLILDEKQIAYFCFPKALKEGWVELENNWQNLKEVEIEYETNERGSNKVTSLKEF